MQRAAALVFFFLGSFPLVRGQSINASLTGRITDPSKAAIADAKVSAISATTNVRYESTSNSTGS